MKSPQKRSFVRRISWNMLILVLVSNLAVCFVAYGFFYQRIVSEATGFGRNMLMANQQVVDHYFRQIDQIADGIIYNDSINHILKSNTDTTDLLQELKSVERIFFHSRSDLRLFFYKESLPENVYSIYTSGYYEEIADFKTSYWYRSLAGSGQKRILLTNIHSEGEQSGDDFVHSLIYQIDDLYGEEAVGYLRIDMDLEKLQEQLILDYNEIEGVEILSVGGEVLFYSDRQLSLPEELPAGLSGSDAKTVQELSTRDAIYCYVLSEETGWIMVLSISKADLYQDEMVLFFYFLAFLFLSLAVCLFAVHWNTDILTSNMNYLTDGIHAVKQGDLKAQVKAGKVDEEIDRVIVDFNEMVKRTHELMMKVESKQALLDEVQIKALQQQINPHFIYNSLETLMGMATEGMNQEIIEICKCMSAMLRYNTKMEESSTLGKEIRQVQSYTKVMEMRMQGSFRTEFAVDPKYLDAGIVKFALQPLVENAIGHGMRNKAKGGRIILEVKQSVTGNNETLSRRNEGAGESEEIEIRIADNGTGMAPEKLSYLKGQLSMEGEDYLKQISESSTTGLLNVHLRMKIFFGDAYRMEIGSRLGEGTDIRIRIPVLWSKEVLQCIG